MEPMTLGSPAQSPVHLGQPPNFSAFQSPAAGGHSSALGPPGQGGFNSPALAGSQMQQSNPAFLPNFLMGQPQQPTNRVMSPTGLNRSMSNMASSVTPTLSQPQSNKPVNGFLTPTTPASAMGTPSEKPGGPPVKGLFVNTPTQKKFGTPLNGTPYGGTPKMLNGTPLNTTPQLSFGATPAPASNLSTSFREQDVIDNSWVTVFGFPPSAACYILSQFSQCGTILQHYVPPNGNWMNIRFQTKMQAQKALGRSGRVFNGTLMIGVSVCHEPPSEAVANSSQMLEQTGTHLDASVVSLNSSLATHNRSIRPLTQSYKAAHNEHEISAIANTPNKNSGLVARTMEYIFGW